MGVGLAWWILCWICAEGLFVLIFWFWWYFGLIVGMVPGCVYLRLSWVCCCLGFGCHSEWL